MKKSLLIKNCQAYNSQKSKNKNKESEKFCIFLNTKNSFKVLLLIVGLSSLAYIFQINQLATMGKELNDKELKLEELEEKQKEMEVKISQFKANYSFKSVRERLNLVSPKQISFIEIDNNESMAMVD